MLRMLPNCHSSSFQALEHFRHFRKVALRTGDTFSLAASELCIAHMHSRLAISQGGDGDGRHQGEVDNTRQPHPDPANEGPHLGLVEARRHYFRYTQIYATSHYLLTHRRAYRRATGGAMLTA